MPGMPRYISHKTVQALEIRRLGDVTVNALGQNVREIDFVEPGFGPLFLQGHLFSRYVPVPGDFYVVYEDGYVSFSPRKAFIEGYKPIGQSFAQIKQGLKDSK